MTYDKDKAVERPDAQNRCMLCGANLGIGKGHLTACPKYRVTEQAPPEPNDKPAIWDLVMADFKARDAEGRRKYGTPLQAGNGRDALVDAYQEALDLVVYLRQVIEERQEEREKIAAWLERIRMPELAVEYAAKIPDQIRKGEYER